MALVVGGRTIMGNATSNPTAAEGNIYWNSSSDELLVYNGSDWQKCNNPPYGTSSNPATDPWTQLRSSASGNYWIQPSGWGQAHHVQMNNTDHGGGWVLAARVLNSNMDHYNTGAVNISGTTGPRTTNTNTQKFSDTMINQLRSASSYSGSTAWWLQSQNWSTGGTSWNMNMFVKTAANFHGTDHANSSNDRTIVSSTFEGTLSDRNPNSGTRGFGDHHTDSAYFAWVRHPEDSGNHGFRQDSRGNSSGYLWVK